jgi:hypothetical protein
LRKAWLGEKLSSKAAWTSDPGAFRGNEEMTPQDVVSLTPPRGMLAMIAMMLMAMAACFWTPEVEHETVHRD